MPIGLSFIIVRKFYYIRVRLVARIFYKDEGGAPWGLTMGVKVARSKTKHIYPGIELMSCPTIFCNFSLFKFYEKTMEEY